VFVSSRSGTCSRRHPTWVAFSPQGKQPVCQQDGSESGPIH